MKIKILSMSLIVLLVAFLLAAPPEKSKSLSVNLRNLADLVKITDEPFEMHDTTATLCKASARKQNPHEPVYPEKVFCNVYTNKIAAETMKTGTGIYPTGSVIVKSKLRNINSAKAELFTVMQKMEAGYDPDHGDWIYFVVDGTYRQIASGKIDSCIDCHQEYQETDFVTRTYLKK